MKEGEKKARYTLIRGDSVQRTRDAGGVGFSARPIVFGFTLVARVGGVPDRARGTQLKRLETKADEKEKVGEYRYEGD